MNADGAVPESELQQNLHDPFCRASVPAVRNPALLPRTGHHVAERRTQKVGIFTDEHVASYLYRLDMFRITVQRYTGDIVESRFLGDIPRIGDDSPCMCRKISKFKIPERFDNVKTR